MERGGYPTVADGAADSGLEHASATFVDPGFLLRWHEHRANPVACQHGLKVEIRGPNAVDAVLVAKFKRWGNVHGVSSGDASASVGWIRLKDDRRESALGQVQGRRQAGQSAPDDNHLLLLGVSIPVASLGRAVLPLPWAR